MRKCTACGTNKMDIWFDGKKGEALCGKCYTGGND